MPAEANRAVLPHDADAERSTIGGVMIDPELLDVASAIVTPEDFYSLHNRRIWAAMLELVEDDIAIDALTVRVRLEERGWLKDVDLAYLYGLVDGVPRSQNVPDYAARVRELADRRRLILTARKLEAQAFDQEAPILDVSDGAQRALLELTAERQAGGPILIGEVLRDKTWPALEEARATLSQHRGIPGLPTGFVNLDAQLAGLQGGRVYLVGARTSIGKSAFAKSVVVHVGIRLGRPVLVFTLEDSADDFTVRTLVDAAQVNGRHVRGGCSSPSDWHRVTSTMLLVAAAPIILDDTATLTTAELRARMRRVHAEHGPLALVVLDYVQLLHDAALRAETRAQELGDISRTIRALAKELNVPIVVLAQLNRQVEQRAGGRPQLSDLRDSGSLEQDADVVLLLNRQPDEPTAADVIIAKNRTGPTGTVKLAWLAEQMRFANFGDTEMPVLFAEPVR